MSSEQFTSVCTQDNVERTISLKFKGEEALNALLLSNNDFLKSDYKQHYDLIQAQIKMHSTIRNQCKRNFNRYAKSNPQLSILFILENFKNKNDQTGQKNGQKDVINSKNGNNNNNYERILEIYHCKDELLHVLYPKGPSASPPIQQQSPLESPILTNISPLALTTTLGGTTPITSPTIPPTTFGGMTPLDLSERNEIPIAPIFPSFFQFEWDNGEIPRLDLNSSNTSPSSKPISQFPSSSSSSVSTYLSLLQSSSSPKLFFSTAHVNNGNWVQFYGPGTTLYDGHPSFKLCLGSLCDPTNVEDVNTSPADHIIRLKWE